MELIGAIIFATIFAAITAHKFVYGLFVLCALLPSYVLRFSLGPLPSTYLEIMVSVLFLFTLFQVQKSQWKSVLSAVQKHKLLCVSIFLFLLGATVSLFTSVDLRSAAGEWKAFYMEPALLFFILLMQARKKEHRNIMIAGLLLSGVATSLLAIYQHFTGFMVPHAFWANGNSYRVTAWYGFPNGVGLFLPPLVLLALYKVYSHIAKEKVHKSILLLSILLLITGPLGILYAKSTGGLVGLAAGIGLFLLYIKQTRWPAVVLGVISLILILSMPQLQSIKQELLFADRSGQIRLSIYGETMNLLKDHPIKGAGLASYSSKIEPYHTTVHGEGIEIFHHPHNLFLSIWINTGIIGLIGFVGMLIWFLRQAVLHIKKREVFFILTALIVVLVTGLVDTPYIKNDLSIFYWMLFALLFTAIHEKRVS